MLCKLLLLAAWTLNVLAVPVDQVERRRIPVPVAEDLLEDPNEVAAVVNDVPLAAAVPGNEADSRNNEGFQEVDPTTGTVKEMAVFASSELQTSLNAGPLYLLKVTYAEVKATVGSDYKLSLDLLSFGGKKSCDVLISDASCLSEDNCPWTDGRKLMFYECNDH